MTNILALRREDLSKKGEQRAAISPELARELVASGHQLLVQSGRHPQSGEVKRIFPDEEYAAAGALITEDLSPARVVFGLKEIETAKLMPAKAYYFFSHTHKGQLKNRGMLHSLCEKGCTLIDYELMADERGQRVLTAFTYFAGYAGMTDSLWALGQRLLAKGITNPFTAIPQAIEKADLQAVKDLIAGVGRDIAQKGTPEALPPVICCFLGAGKTSTGAQSMYQLLNPQHISLEELPHIYQHGSRKKVYQLVLDIPEMYRFRAESSYRGAGLSRAEVFELYLREPQHFESNMDQVFPWCTLLMNCILWSPAYPRLISRADAARWYAQADCLQVIGDITCDPEGAIEFSQETWIDQPVFVYDPHTQSMHFGFEGDGIAVMAVTNLPCEFSADASRQFASELRPYMQRIAGANYEAEAAESAGLPPEVLEATILWKGKFTEKYAYMQQFIEQSP